MLALSSPSPDFASSRLAQFARHNARALILACGLLGALAFWPASATSETQCLLVNRSALGWHAAASLSIALTALAWVVHRPALDRLSALRRRIAAR